MREADFFGYQAEREMKAISLWEPWASAMALGLKANETRSWATGYRGDLVICAAKRPLDRIAQQIWEERIKPLADGGYEPAFGCAVCVVELYECVPTLEVLPSEMEEALGNYDSGRWAWLTRNLRWLKKPVPVKGRQGFFHVLEKDILANLEPFHVEQVGGPR